MSSAPPSRPKGSQTGASAAPLSETLRSAAEAYGRGAWTEAEMLCHRVLDAKADQVDALNLLGMIAAQTQRTYDAATLFGRAVAASPENARLRLYHGITLQQLRRLDEALESYAHAIRLDPDLAEAHSNRGSVLQQLGRADAALESYSQAIRLKPDLADAHYNLGNLLQESRRLNEALESYAKAIRLRPDFAKAIINRGSALQALGRPAEAVVAYDDALRIEPDSPEVHYSRGRALQSLGRLSEALESYDHALALRPSYAEAANNRGTALQALKRLEQALESYERALRYRPDFADALSNRGNALQALGRQDEALDSLDRALKVRPDFTDAHYNRGNVLQALGRLDDAVASYDRALALKPDDAAAWNNRGSALQKLRRLNAALEAYDRALQLDPNYAAAWNNRGNALQELMCPAEAQDCYARALALDPAREYCYGAWLHTKMKVCDWNGLEGDIAELIEKIGNGARATMPFPVLALSDSLPLQRRAAEIWVQDEHPARPSRAPIARRERSAKIRIGYYSADFFNHATAYLIAELFERHDRDRFELHAFSFGPDSDDEWRTRIRAAADRFIDVRRATDREIALQSREREIDIAIDLKGLTQHNRLGIFALRAAPIQVAYLGYPGTSGAEYIDYLIADRVVIPEGSRQQYSEKVAWLPNSYQVNDRKRPIAATAVSREALGLPRAGFVYCCFNSSYKITPETFDGWMRIVGQVEGSVLWLLEDNPAANLNLRKEAQIRGVDGDRLIFAKRLPAAEHLARHRAADLFLDTFPCNAHTTASDALWAGLPLVTLLGESFAGRVAASLLAAIGIPELVTATHAQYEAAAIDLARNPARLARIRERLTESRLTAPLFDTQLFARHIEDAYVQMYERFQSGLPPEHLDVRP
jgi:protein O-GlcNAc transferase